MAEKATTSQRDAVLVTVLERLSDQIRQQNQAFDEIAKQQLGLSKAVENERLSLRARQDGAEEASGKLLESVARYRSDMLSLVNEQDAINKNIADLNSLVNKTAYALEKNNQDLAELNERVTILENAAKAHFEHSLKQADILPKEIEGSTRSITKLHMDTEKNLGKAHQETQKQLEKLQQDTARRLLVLGDMEIALQTLLVRTEPPEKKPAWPIRLFRRAIAFCRAKLARLQERKKPRAKDP
ncbi:MAG: hypothetical protein FWH57_06685 [Oscillospiraceae bacterium]|nr:hypothetical protein [Oscillospiraceae bacterium]